MIPCYEPIELDVQRELRIELSTLTRVFHYSYRQLHDMYEEAVFYATKSTVDQHMVHAFRLNPPKDPMGAVSLDDFTSLGNTLFVYGYFK
jgi:hypothetical protein